MSDTWFSLGVNEDVEILARAWKPGDGVQCSSAAAQRREPCGPPVAMVESVTYRRAYIGGKYVNTDHIDRRVVRCACAEHLAGRLGHRYGNARSEMVARATKRATDEIVTKHWKQYQTAYERALSDERESLLQGIPENLRDIFLATVEPGGAS